MSTRPAPKLAVWLLEHCGCSSNNEALIGDLTERYQKGRTAAWYWKQTATAILTGACGNVRSQNLAAIRGLIGGWLVYWTLGYLFFHFGIYQVILDSLRLDNPDLLIGSWAPPVWWHSARFGTIYTFAANAIATLAMFLIGALSGWTLATLFRPNQRTAVFLFSTTVMLSWSYYSMTLGPRDIGATFPWSLYFWMNSAIQSLGILMGSLWAESVPPTVA